MNTTKFTEHENYTIKSIPLDVYKNNSFWEQKQAKSSLHRKFLISLICKCPMKGSLVSRQG